MTIHNCPPPVEELKIWLKDYCTVEGNYGHLLLEQVGDNTDSLITAMSSYFESALLDGRQHFHSQIGISLHPDAGDAGSHAQYPECLPLAAKRGIFGEALAGLVTEAYPFVGEHEWAVPVFLFRYHADVEAYLFALSRDPDRERQIFGRFGSDFIGVSFSEEGAVVRLISGEAKWRQSLTQGVADKLLLGEKIDDPEGSGAKVHSGKGIWHEVNRDSNPPHGLRQLQRLLEDCDPENYSAAILSMDKALLLKGSEPLAIPRSRQNPKPLGRYDAEIIGYIVA